MLGLHSNLRGDGFGILQNGLREQQRVLYRAPLAAPSTSRAWQPSPPVSRRKIARQRHGELLHEGHRQHIASAKAHPMSAG